MKSSLLWLLAFSTLSGMALGQDGLFYLTFKLQPAGKHVEVSWQVQSGNTCQDVQVWRAADSLHLQHVYTYPGICGDADSVKTYRYLDSPPGPGTYYYRIQVFTDRTTTKKVVLPPQEGFVFYPNPAGKTLRLLHNPGHSAKRLEVLDGQGKLVRLYLNPSPEQDIDLAQLSSGTYIFRVHFSSGQIQTQQLVVRN